MEKRYPHLFSPIKIGGLTLKNRIEAAPTSLEDFTEREYVPRGWIEYYGNRAAGGAAIVSVGETPVMSSNGPTQHHMLAVDDPDIMPWLNKVADAIHQHGAAASIELSHGLNASMRMFLHGNKAWAVSACKSPFDGEDCEEMTEEMIRQLIGAFGDAARRCQICGFDMVNVHAGHGWGIAQFLSPLTNRRTDRWGGSVENRMRFLLEVIADIKAKCGKDFPVEVRISGTETVPGGWTLEDAVEYCKLLDGVADLLHISIGTVQVHIPTYGGQSICSPSFYEPRGRNVYLAEEIKKHITKTPVLTLGALGLPDELEEIIASGKADMVAMARALIADPDLPKKARCGQVEDIRPCLRCTGCLDDTMIGPQVIRCAVNPTIGREIEYRMHHRIPRETKTVLVVGGGPAGMQAAIAAGEQGHKVTLCEQKSELGGAMLYNKRISFKGDILRFAAWQERQMKKYGVKICLNTKVTPDFLEMLDPDVVICAIGAEASVPPIPGVDGENVMLFTDAHDRMDEIGHRVVIIGAGPVGCELSTQLGMDGHDVTVVEQAGLIMPAEAMVLADEGDGVSNVREYTQVNMWKNGVKTAFSMNVTQIGRAGVTATDQEGKEVVFPADTVIIATGMKPLEAEREALRAATALEYIVAGDCQKVGRIKDATAAGQAAGYYIG